jgi:hypothetical protein
MPKMKAYATFDLYLADQPPKNRAIIRALRAFVKRAAPRLVESVKWGNGCWLKGKAPVAYVYSDAGFVQFGFIRGSALDDPRGLLAGKAQHVRHIKVHGVDEIDAKAFGALLRQAIQATPENQGEATSPQMSLVRRRRRVAARATDKIVSLTDEVVRETIERTRGDVPGAPRRHRVETTGSARRRRRHGSGGGA